MNQRSRRIARQFDDEDEEEIVLQKIYKFNRNKWAVDTLKFLRIAIMPLIESYSIAAFTLEKLVGRQLLENELLDEIVKEIKLQLSNGTIKYGKSLAIEILLAINLKCHLSVVKFKLAQL